MSPTKRPFQPTFLAFVANRSTKRMSCGLPQLRLRDGRMTCQAGPVIGSDSAPARQPLKSPPIERGGPGNGVDLRANSSLAGIDGASGFFSGGSGLGSGEPGSIGSIKCFSCATAELAAARKRTARRQTTARISNDTPYGSIAAPPRVSCWGVAEVAAFACQCLLLEHRVLHAASRHPAGPARLGAARGGGR